MTQFGGLFDRIEPGICAELAASEREARFDAGHDLFGMGDRPDYLYYLRSGRVKIWRPNRSGTALTLFYLGPGSPVGLLGVQDGGEMEVTATAVTAIDAFYWPAPLIRRLLQQDARLANNGLRILGNALRLVAYRLEDVTGATAEQQISRALLRLAGEHARWSDDGATAIDVSRQELADLTGTTLYTASRTLSDWGRQGLVESGRGRVVIKDAHALAALADVEG